MVDEGESFIHPGVLFIDDSHLLDLEAFSFLGRALESELVPIIILATDGGVTTIRGTDVKSLMGSPLDLVDCSVMIATHEYDAESVREILRIRTREEKVTIDNDALEKPLIFPLSRFTSEMKEIKEKERREFSRLC